MKPSFEYSIAEIDDQEHMLRVRPLGFMAGATATYLAYTYVAGKHVLPDALTEEVLGNKAEGVEDTFTVGYATDKTGETRVNDLRMLLSGREQQVDTFVVSLDPNDLSQTAEQIHSKFVQDLGEHKPTTFPHDNGTISVRLELFDSTFSVDPVAPFSPKENLKGTQTYSTRDLENFTKTEQKDDKGFGFPAYGYKLGAQTDKAELYSKGSELQKLVQPRFNDLIEEATVENATVAGLKAVPYTADQYESLARLAQNSVHGTVENMLANYTKDPQLKAEVEGVFLEKAIIVDRPSVLVRVTEKLTYDGGIDIHACQLEETLVRETYHVKQYDPAPVPLGILGVAGALAGGLHYYRRRRALKSEQLRKLGLEAPAPSEEAFEAVKHGSANTRQKLEVLRYQKASEVEGTKDRRHFHRGRLLATGCLIVSAYLAGILGTSTTRGQKPDAKPDKSSQVHIVSEANKCSPKDNLAILPMPQDEAETKDYIIGGN